MILLPDDRFVSAARWVTRGVLDELAARGDLPPGIADKVRWCLDAQFDTLDLRDAPAEELAQLARVLDAVIADTEARGAASFDQAELFPAFVGKLRELRVLLDPAARRLDGIHLFAYGSEGAPGPGIGLLRLQIQPDGRFRFQQRQRGQLLVERTGSIAPRAVEEISAQLAAARFPAVPAHETPPGGDDFTVSSGDRTAFLNATRGRDFPGYGPLIRRLLPWMRYLVACEGEAPAELLVDRPKGA